MSLTLIVLFTHWLNYFFVFRKGVGSVKAAGNYAADLKSQVSAKAEGYPISLYLDSTEKRYNLFHKNDYLVDFVLFLSINL